MPQQEGTYSVPKTISTDQSVPLLVGMATPLVVLAEESARKIQLPPWVSGREMRQNAKVCKKQYLK